LEEWEKAEKAFNSAIETNPQDWHCWFGLVKVHTKNLTDTKDKRHLSFLDKAKKIADSEGLVAIERAYSRYGENLQKYQQEAFQTIINRRQFGKKIGIVAIFAGIFISIVLVATLTPKRSTITFDARDGTVSTTSIKTRGNESLKLPYAMHSDFYCEGWYTSTQWKTKITENTYAKQSLSQNRTLYARWQRTKDIVLTSSNWKDFIYSVDRDGTKTQYIIPWDGGTHDALRKMGSTKSAYVIRVFVINVTMTGGGASHQFTHTDITPSALFPRGTSVSVSGTVKVTFMEQAGGGWAW